MSTDIIDADYIVNVPVLKTHGQTIVSLGVKNLKGALDMASRQTFHGPGHGLDLDACVSMLPGLIPPSFTIIDGIYTLERGPIIYGEAHRSNILVASQDVVSADKVGARLLGYPPGVVRHIAMACQRTGRPTDLTDINVIGGIDTETVLKPHAWRFEYSLAEEMPLIFELSGVSGVRFPPADHTMCTYCSHLILYLQMGILMAVNKSKRFDDIEILIGRNQEPRGGQNHTLLVGQCQVRKNGTSPLIKHCVPVHGCPPSIKDFLDAYRLVGIELPDDSGDWMKTVPEFFMMQYGGRPEFDEALYRVPS